MADTSNVRTLITPEGDEYININKLVLHVLKSADVNYKVGSEGYVVLHDIAKKLLEIKEGNHRTT